MALGAMVAPGFAVQSPSGTEAPASPPPADATAKEHPPTQEHPLKQIVLVETPEAAKNISYQPDGAFVIATGSLKSLESADLTQRLIAAKGRNIDTQLLGAVVQVVAVYARQHGFMVVDVGLPDQNIGDGALRLTVVPGKFRSIKFVGNRWFSESQLLGELHVSGGKIISVPDLNQALAWTNDSNPFRRVQAQVQPVPNSNEADLVIGVQERLPLRLVTNFDNDGNDIIGNYHYAFGATYANLWNLDHQLSYQYITTGKGANFQGQVLNYRAPLPWHHFISLNASYLVARPTGILGVFDQDAKNFGADLRYSIPFKRGDDPGELFATLSFKESNSDLIFLGVDHTSSKTDVFELTLGGTRMYRDKLGGWLFGTTLTLSPGNLNELNSDDAFFNARGGTKSRYLYGNLSAQRTLTLTGGWELNSRASLQFTSEALLGSEQFTVGGSTTVRGFSGNVFIGDEGFVFSNDLLTPVWHNRVSVRGKQFVPLETRFLAFYDAGQARNKHHYFGEPAFHPMASTGVGVRMSWASNFSCGADYGWQITRLPFTHQDHGAGHIKVSLAY